MGTQQNTVNNPVGGQSINSEANKQIQLMILLAAGEIESCKHNAEDIYYKRYKDNREKLLTTSKN